MASGVIVPDSQWLGCFCFSILMDRQIHRYSLDKTQEFHLNFDQFGTELISFFLSRVLFKLI